MGAWPEVTHPEAPEGAGRAVTRQKMSTVLPERSRGARLSYTRSDGAGLYRTIRWYIPRVCFGVTLTAVIGGDQWRGARER